VFWPPNDFMLLPVTAYGSGRCLIRLKIPWPQGHAGSTPASGTTFLRSKSAESDRGLRDYGRRQGTAPTEDG